MKADQQYRIIAWKTDAKLNPTGEERRFLSSSCRKVAKQLAYEYGGEQRLTLAYLSDGTIWCARAYEKIKP
jgi:hypothetical protein